MIDPTALAAHAERRFSLKPSLFRAPGRVNLIGEHTDYNDGFVLPAAIGFHTWIAMTPRDDDVLHIESINFSETRERPLASLAVARANATVHWSDYVFGVARCLRASGVRLRGANLVVHGDVPLGSGLSSSASLETAVAVALLHRADASRTPTQIAQLCQQAENEDVGMRCGIMDQFASAQGIRDHAILLDCRSLNFDAVPLGEQSIEKPRIVVCNTMVKHQHAGGEYNDRRQQCETAVAALSRVLPELRALRDVSGDDLQRHAALLDPLTYRRARHVTSENQRVLDTARAMRQGDFIRVGEAMRASHLSLRDDYEVSCPELDLMVDLASQVPGTYGARMTGGGFGGCTVNLVRPDAVDHFRQQVSEAYARATGIQPDIHVCDCVAGASELASTSDTLS